MLEFVSVKQNVFDTGILPLLVPSVFKPTPEKLRSRAEKYIKRPNTHIFACREGGKYIGIVVFEVVGTQAAVLDIAVDKACRKRGVGSRLLSFILENFNISELTAETDDDAVGFYKKFGFSTTEIKTIHGTKRYLCTVKDANLIERKVNTQIRIATPNDAERFAEIHARSWIFAYGGCVPESVLAEHNARWPLIWSKMLANNRNSHYAITTDNTTIGFLTLGTTRDSDLSDTVCELVGLYLDPKYIGKCFGRQAMDWVKREAISRNYKNLCLWVLKDNLNAKSFYERSGFIFDGTTKPSGLGDTVEERYILKFGK